MSTISPVSEIDGWSGQTPKPVSKATRVRKHQLIQIVILIDRSADGPASGIGYGAARISSTVSSPAGGERQGYRVDPPRQNYAQAPSGRGGQDPAEPPAAHIPTQALPAGLRGDGQLDAVAGVPIGAQAGLDGAWGPSLVLPPPPAGQGQLKPIFA